VFFPLLKIVFIAFSIFLWLWFAIIRLPYYLPKSYLLDPA
jgi:hypothetical protein